jgi:hypothetical protein
MTAACPACGRDQDDGLLCAGCTSTLRYELSDVPSIVYELDLTISRQTRIPQVGAILERPERAEDEIVASGLAHERLLPHLGAVQAADDLASALTYWARVITGIQYGRATTAPSVAAAAALRSHTDEIRRYGDVVELYDGVLSATRHARHTIDQPNQRRIDVGPCPETPCPGIVQAVLPADDKRPPVAFCKANPEHHWASDQFVRLGRRMDNAPRKGAA